MLSRNTIFLAVVLSFQISRTVGTVDPEAYANYLNNNKADAIAADSILGKLTPFFTGYASLNDAVPTGILVNCHYGSTAYNNSASNSSAAADYLHAVHYKVGDNYVPVTDKEPIHEYNQSWSLGLIFIGRCILEDGKPTCTFSFDAASRASGLAQITRVPDSAKDKIKFVSCAVYMDGNFATSKTCFQDNSFTYATVKVPFNETSVAKIAFFSEFEDTSPDGPPGIYARQYACQFAWNSAIIFNGFENMIGLDPRLTAPLPLINNGFFGPAGNGGSIGRRLLRSLGFSRKEQKVEPAK